MKINILAIIILYSNIVFANSDLDNLIPKESDQILNPDNIKNIIEKQTNDLSNKTQDDKIEKDNNQQHEQQLETIDNDKSKNLEDEVKNKQTDSIIKDTNVDDSNKSNVIDIKPKTQDSVLENDKDEKINESIDIKKEDIKESKSSVHVEKNKDIDKIKSEITPIKNYHEDTNHNYKISDVNYSLMFSNKEIDSINKAIRDFLTSENLINVNQSTSQDNDSDDNRKALDNIVNLVYEKPKNIPSFFLNSIIYKNKDDWTVWINSKQVKAPVTENISFDENNNINIIYMSEGYIIFKWKTLFLNDFCPNWMDYLNRDINIGYYSDNNDIIIDEDRKTVTFKLKVNQTFSVQDMSIKEGYKAPSIFIESEKKDNIDKLSKDLTNSLK